MLHVVLGLLSVAASCPINLSSDPNVTSSNIVQYLTMDPSCHYSQLRTLTINNINLGSLPPSLFAGLTSLTSIHINYCSLTTLSGGAFASLSALTYLSLAYNLLATLPVNTFTDMNTNNGTPLTLDLSNNVLVTLPTGLFANSKGLTKLYLNNNQLVSLEAQVFDGAPLRTLDLSFNNLTGFVTGTFKGLTLLNELFLSNNKLVPAGLHSSMLAESILLSTINIKNNPDLVSLPAGLFSPLTLVVDVQMDKPPGCSFLDLPVCAPCQVSLTCFYLVTVNGPTTRAPTSLSPSSFPTRSPSTSVPTFVPTYSPTHSPSRSPSRQPTRMPSTFSPTSKAPTSSPTSKAPTSSPTSQAPTYSPSFLPTSSPSPPSSVSAFPSYQPSASPSPNISAVLPTNLPSRRPSRMPTPAFAGAQTGGGSSGGAESSELTFTVGLPVLAVVLVVGLILFCVCYRRKLTIDGKILVHLQNEVAVGPGSRGGSIFVSESNGSKQGPVDLRVAIPSPHLSSIRHEESSPGHDSVQMSVLPDLSILRPSPAPSSPAPRPPTMPEIPANEVEVGVALGNGAFGSVHQCLWRGTDYALKRLLNPDQGASFEKEVEINRQLAGLPHIYVTRMVGFISNPTAGIVMELYPMGNVEDFLKINLLEREDFASVLTLLVNASAGVMHLHSMGIIHRDLAARNFLIKQDLSAAVCDFGLAMPLPEGKSRGQRTPAERQTDMLPVNVAAPETLDEGIYSTASDVYMFGLFIWEVLARQTPHAERKEFTQEHRDFKGFIRKVVHEDLRPPLSPEWPSSLRLLLAQCWHRNPGARPTMLHVNDILRHCRKEIVANNIPLPRPRPPIMVVEQHAYYSPAPENPSVTPRLDENPVPPSADRSAGRPNLYGRADGNSPPSMNIIYADPDQVPQADFVLPDMRNHPYFRPQRELNGPPPRNDVTPDLYAYDASQHSPVPGPIVVELDPSG